MWQDILNGRESKPYSYPNFTIIYMFIVVIRAAKEYELKPIPDLSHQLQYRSPSRHAVQTYKQFLAESVVAFLKVV